MKKMIQKLFKSPFVKNVAIMASGTVGAQVVAMAMSPFITRLYGPDAFGIMGTFTALTRLIIPIAALTYPIAIVLPKSDKNAKALIKLSMYITFFMVSVTTSVVFLLNNKIVDVFQIQEIGPYLYLIPLVILFAGLVEVAEQWFIRTNQFSVNAKATFMQSIVTNGSKAGIGFVYPTTTVLVILQAAGNGIKAFLMVIFAKKSIYKSASNVDEEVLTLKRLAKKYRDFPIYRAPEVFINAVSGNLPILLLTSFFGPASAGFYNIGRTVLQLPSKLIGKSIGDVFYPRISEAANTGEDLNKLIKKATLALVAIGIIPFGLVVLFGPWLFEFVFGSEWGVAGEYARWIALLSFSTFINKPSVKSMPVLKAQRFHLIFTLLLLITQFSALFIGFFVFEDDLTAVALFGLSGALLHSMFILVILWMSSRFNRKFI